MHGCKISKWLSWSYGVLNKQIIKETNDVTRKLDGEKKGWTLNTMIQSLIIQKQG